MKKLICALLAVFILLSFTGCGTRSYEDTNGEDDYSLQTITEADIIRGIGSSIFMSSTVRNNHVTVCTARTMSGVAKLFELDLNGEDLDLTVSCSITKGNARLVLVINDEIVHDFGLKGMNQNFTLENVTGAVSLRIAGESTGYSIKYELK